VFNRYTTKLTGASLSSETLDLSIRNEANQERKMENLGNTILEQNFNDFISLHEVEIQEFKDNIRLFSVHERQRRFREIQVKSEQLTKIKTQMLDAYIAFQE